MTTRRGFLGALAAATIAPSVAKPKTLAERFVDSYVANQKDILRELRKIHDLSNRAVSRAIETRAAFIR